MQTKHEHCHINLDNRDKGTLAEKQLANTACDVRKTRPDATNFAFIPRHSPHLRSFVESVNWNCFEKIISISIFETPAFSAFKWFGSINERRAVLLKSAFPDIEQESVTVCFYDQHDKEVARLCFKGIELVYHSTDLSQNHSLAQYGVESAEDLKHFVKIQYAEVVELQLPEEPLIEFKDLIDCSEGSNFAVDEEWVKVDQ